MLVAEASPEATRPSRAEVFADSILALIEGNADFTVSQVAGKFSVAAVHFMDDEKRLHIAMEGIDPQSPRTVYRLFTARNVTDFGYSMGFPLPKKLDRIQKERDTRRDYNLLSRQTYIRRNDTFINLVSGVVIPNENPYYPDTIDGVAASRFDELVTDLENVSHMLPINAVSIRRDLLDDLRFLG